MGIELRHLATFVAVVECGGFRRAAARLYLSQPAVSAHVRSLEQAVGATLLVRAHAGVTTTPQGERVLTMARAVLAEVEDALDLRATALGRRLRIGVLPPGVGGTATQPVLDELLFLMPAGLQVSFVPLWFADWAMGVPESVDVLLTRDPVAPEWSRTTAMWESRLCVAMLRQDADGRTELDLATVDRLPFARLADGLPTWLTGYWSLGTERGEAPRWVGDDCWTLSDVGRSVFAGLGVTGAPSDLAPNLGTPDTTFLPVSDARTRPRVVIASRIGDRRPIVEHVHAAAARIGEDRRVGPAPELAQVPAQVPW